MNLDLMLIVAPIFLLIVLGHLLRRGGIPSVEFWNLNDKLVYWVLFPSLLYDKTSTMDLSSNLFGELFTIIYAGFAAAVIFALLVGRLAGLDRPLLTSVLQGSARHNTFIALAVAERLFGAVGLAQATLIVALLVPVTNITVVTSMVTLLRGDGSRGLGKAIVRDLIRNPLIIAIALGFLVNLSGFGELPVINEMARILGAAALPIVLLCVGANIHVRKMAVSALPMAIAAVGKLIVFPLGILLACIAIGTAPELALVAMIFGAVPTAAASFTLARAMGGDAPAMAAIVTIETALAPITLPLTLMAAEAILRG
jgi:malonate transporter